MKWDIEVKLKYKIYKVSAEIIETTERKEKIKITGYWNRSIVLENNRNFFVAKNLKHRKWDWKVIEGNVRSASFVEELVKELEIRLRAS